MLTKTPKTKQELSKAIQQLNLDQFKVLDIPKKSDSATIKKELETFIGSSTKPITVVFLKGRT